MESYKNLSSYILATVIFDLTVEFCRRWIDPKSRTTDQMTQAARSGKQNIAEGASVQSLESYIKLLGVTEGSQRELAADFEDYLRQHKLPIWDKDDTRTRRVREFRAVWVSSNQPNTPNLPKDPTEAANVLLTFCQMETFLLKRQIEALKEKFVREGGFRENLFKKRMAYHKTSLTKLISLILVLLGGVVWLGVMAKPVHAANSGNFTMSLWVNPSGSVASKALIGKAEEFRVFTDANGKPGCQIKATSWQTAVGSSTAISVGSWAHVICTYDLVNLKIYVNGVLRGTQAETDLPDDTAAVLRIGQDDSASTTYTNLAGLVDEFRFYNYALTSDEVLLDFNAGSALKWGSVSDTSGLTGGSTASTSASAAYCIPGDTTSCAAPVAEWNFEEGSGTSVADSSGNSNTGTWSGTGNHWTTGKFGKAGGFNGGNDYVSVNHNASITPTGDYTLEAWVKTSDTRNHQPVVAKFDSSSYPGYLFAVGDAVTAGKVALWVGDVGSGWVTGTTSVNNGIWHHIVGVLSGTTVNLYVDGNLDKSLSRTPSRANTSVLNIGRRYDLGANPWLFNGSIDQVRIFNYARTASQIAWDYNRGGPVGWWKMNECTGTAIHDSSGNNLTGTLTNATAGTCDDGTSTTAWGGGKTGKYGASLYFNGADYVSTPNSSSINFGTNDFSLGVWIKTTSTAYSPIVYKYNGDTTRGYMLYVNATTNKALFQLWSTGGVNQAVAISATSINDGNWHYLVGVRSGTTNYIYVDGKQSGSATGATSDTTGTGLLYIGSDRTPGNFFNGQLDDVRVYNYALTAVQVKTLYNENAAVRFGP